jgi:RimJ/RimL family protein N-acetyltransferase
MDVILFRAATSWDSGMLYEWRNDPETRANSRDTAHVDATAHARWFRRSQMNPDRMICIAETGMAGVPVAVIRLDRRADNSFELSWTVAPEHRGKGYGTEVLKRFIAELPRPVRLYAEIKPSNLASLKMAERAGMQQQGMHDDLLLFELAIA